MAPAHRSSVLIAAVAQHEGLTHEQACLVHGYSFITDLLGAAQRLGRLSHTEIQRVLDELRPIIGEVVEEYRDQPLDAMWSFAPTTELMGMGHERADRRLFMS
ncbi:urease accessory protein UreF [Natranaeroarchaeum sulfidigenes]|uniref:Urease accessory protein UreF n=1 Tax=Natranaeroarchaeum sulfidigenes TaxID=2784880 RepID=A0A897MT87_9EURY|nr:urease accessory UreF family protein [Natranaeroarchaeum sulfidigenes]QSG02159.1 Urease accessory protein UreF [Natranaeroarchaeum sulfidigenes]